MDFDLTADQERVQRAARDLAAREIEPGAAARDRAARWPAEIVARLGALGWLGMAVPRELGGAGLDPVSRALVVEEIAAACAASAAIVIAHDALFCGPLLAFGTAEQHRAILAPAAAGSEIGAFAFAPGADDLPARAERRPDGSFTLHGATSLVTSGPSAEHFLVLARTSPDGEAAQSTASTALLVRRGAPGITIGPPVETMGLRAAHACTLSFEGVRVPLERVLGAEGGGADVARHALDAGRVGLAALGVGIARAAFEKAAAHLTGAPAPRPPTPQSVQFMISDMAVEIDAARLLVRRAALRRSDGGDAGHASEGAVAKLFASEAATRVTHRAMQIFGARGTTTACGVERHYRDARSTELDVGTSEAQRLSIAAGVLEG